MLASGFKKIAVVAASALAFALVLVGCVGSGPEEGSAEHPVNVVVVGGQVQNQPAVAPEVVKEYFDLAVASSGVVDIVVPDGSPYSAIGGPGAASSAASSSKRRELEEVAISQALATAYGEEAPALTAETDVLSALDLASRDFNSVGNGGENVAVVVHSGLSTSGLLRFQDGLLGAEPSGVVQAVSGELPDLSGIDRLVWVNCGLVSGGQEELPRSQQMRLEETLSAVLAEAGCVSVEFRDLTPGGEPAAGLPSVTTVEVERAPVVVETESSAVYTFSGETLMFCPDSAEFADEAEAFAVLSEVASAAEAREGRVRVQASTASYPWDPEYALALSQERASAAANALVSLGVEADRIDVEGLGYEGADHVEDIDPETGLQIPSAAALNRKVTITIE